MLFLRFWFQRCLVQRELLSDRNWSHGTLEPCRVTSASFIPDRKRRGRNGSLLSCARSANLCKCSRDDLQAIIRQFQGGGCRFSPLATPPAPASPSGVLDDGGNQSRKTTRRLTGGAEGRAPPLDLDLDPRPAP